MVLLVQIQCFTFVFEYFFHELIVDLESSLPLLSLLFFLETSLGIFLFVLKNFEDLKDVLMDHMILFEFRTLPDQIDCSRNRLEDQPNSEMTN